MKILDSLISKLLGGSCFAKSEEITNSSPRFTFQLPFGFKKDDTAAANSQETRLLSFSKAIAPDYFKLYFVSLGAEVRPISKEELAKYSAAGRVLISWKQFQTVKVSEQKDGMAVEYAIVPLKDQGISVYVSSELGNQVEAQKILKEVISTLDGQTNWHVE